MNNKKTWPVRVDGIYLNQDAAFSCRVTAIQDDTIYYLLRTSMLDGKIEEHGPTDCPHRLFCQCYYPEDQSAQAELIDALQDCIAALDPAHPAALKATAALKKASAIPAQKAEAA